MRRQLLAVLLIGAGLLSACKKDKPTGIAGPPAKLTSSPASVSAPANTAVAAGAQIFVQDQNGLGVEGETVTFQVVSGGGSIESATAVSGSNGAVTIPEWTFGKSDVEQRLRAVLGDLTVDVIGSVQTNYDIVVRFYGPAMTQAQKDVFENAAARIRGIITGDLPPVQMNTTLSGCSEQTINEIVDDVVIYASVQSIDGVGQILASAGPCFIRDVGHQTVVGIMQFDLADFNALENDGTLQEVITHEMLHVVGIGSLWDDGEAPAGDPEPLNNLIEGAGTSNPRYLGTQARLACQAVGGTVACATSVPVENTGGEGTADSHWRETTFDDELLTGFAEGGPGMPLSRITIGGLADLGYTVNAADFDAYTIFQNALRASTSPTAKPRGVWERSHPVALRSVNAAGHVTSSRRMR